MQKVILQVPMDKSLRDLAEFSAATQGFSSLQEAVRLFVNKLAKRSINVSFEEVEYLSKSEDQALAKKYKAFVSEKKKGKTYLARSTDELLEQLTS